MSQVNNNELHYQLGQRQAEIAAGPADTAPFPAATQHGGPSAEAHMSTRDPQLAEPWAEGGVLDTLTNAVNDRTGPGRLFSKAVPDSREKRLRDFAFCASPKRNMKRCRKSRRLGETWRAHLRDLRAQGVRRPLARGDGDVFIPNYYQSAENVPVAFGPAYERLVDRLSPIYARGGRKTRRGGRKSRRVGGRKSRRGGRKSTRVGGRKYRRGGRKTRR